METSSPLAALSGGFGPSFGFDKTGPASMLPCRNLFQSHMSLNTFAARRDMSYFDLDMAMTTSPTTCLAADLSQNFHIDKSPAFPTPRRSLFANMNTEAIQRPMTTPPIPSSPGLSDVMDMSPLPHKTPFSMLSKSSCDTPSVPDSSSPAPIDSPCVDIQLQRRPGVDRKKSLSMGRRPLLAPRRNYTTQAVSKVTASKFPFNGDSPQFTFGGRSSAPPMDLDEMFEASPEQQEKRPGIGLNLGGPLQKPRPPLFTNTSSTSIANGSPVPQPARRNMPRPVRKMYRRSLSMFTSAEDVVQPEKTEMQVTIEGSPSQSSIRESQILPCFAIKDDSLKRITKETMVNLLDGHYKHLYDDHLVVDCRFEYEFEGGHIAGAINVNNVDDLDVKFLSTPRSQKTILIFHCEYSAHRAPRMALALRSRDRQVNMHRYPELYYPEVYILEGGYSNFFSTYRQRCEPQFYVEMDDKRHRNTCEREMGKFRRTTKFGRTQSYTFGMTSQNNSHESPLGIRKPMAPKRDNSINIPLNRMKYDTKRMASF